MDNFYLKFILGFFNTYLEDICPYETMIVMIISMVKDKQGVNDNYPGTNLNDYP
jgi:hypothetical protein